MATRAVVRAGPVVLVVLATGLSDVARAGPPPYGLAAFAYTSDHKKVLAKADDWGDPATPAERKPLPASFVGPPSRRDVAIVPLASHTWGTVVRARASVWLEPGATLDGSASLLGDSELAALRLASVGPPELRDGAAVFEVQSPAPLPREIAALEGEIRWTLSVRGRAIPLARSRHTLLVTAGPPRPAASWPSHNAFTAFRMRGAVQLAAGASSANAAAERAWRLMKRHYDLSADRDVNPWSLLDEGTAGQCMTTAAFVEAAVDILGFEGGRIVYVYPSFKRPKDPATSAIPHPLLPGAFTVESAEYDVTGQFRTVKGRERPGLGEHTVEQARRHQGAHGIERLKFLDGSGELHNYATAFVVDEGNVRSYYGGGYGVGPFHAADAFLAGACRTVVWAHEEGNSDEWETVCDAPGPAFVWATGARTRP